MVKKIRDTFLIWKAYAQFDCILSEERNPVKVNHVVVIAWGERLNGFDCSLA